MPTAANSSPPPDITRSSYAAWLKALDSDVSPFLDPVFNWSSQIASAGFCRAQRS